MMSTHTSLDTERGPAFPAGPVLVRALHLPHPQRAYGPGGHCPRTRHRSRERAAPPQQHAHWTVWHRLLSFFAPSSHPPLFSTHHPP